MRSHHLCSPDIRYSSHIFCFSSRIILLSTAVAIILTSMMMLLAVAPAATLDTAFGQLGLTPAPTSNEVQPDYIVRVLPGAALEDSLFHYFPSVVNVPTGTTIAWFNDDPGQPHTVTSGSPLDPDKGILFNSGIIPYGGFFQYTFDGTLEGKFIYHCEIHPWRVGSVGVSSQVQQGNNFEFASGTGQIFNLTSDRSVLLRIKPVSVNMDDATPLTYNFSIFKKPAAAQSGNEENKVKEEKVFSRSFFSLGNELYVELVPNYANRTSVYGPDFSDPITGAYHIEGDFVRGGADYRIMGELTAIGTKMPESRIFDNFNLTMVS
jgi:plastocyanin